MRHLKWLLLLCLIAGVIVSCENNAPPTLPPVTPGGGFILQTSVTINGSLPITAPGVTVEGEWQSDEPGAAGDPSTFTVTTNALALASLSGKRAPAVWKLTWLGGGPASACTGVVAENTVQLNELAVFLCIIQTNSSGTSSAAAFSLAPNPVYTGAPPSGGTVIGSGLSTTYGMPLVQYYTLDGTLIAQENATSVASNGTWMQIPAFNISQLPGGTYAAFVNNAASGGGYTYLGTGAVQVVVGAAPGTGSVTISGSEREVFPCGGCPGFWDGGTLAIFVNGISAGNINYGTSSTTQPNPMPTAASLAALLANAINTNSSLVSATVTGATVNLTSRTGGSSTNYSLSTQVNSSVLHAGFPPASFTLTASGATLTGGNP
jgi:hypothetical protein